jgi:hypothetical protein
VTAAHLLPGVDVGAEAAFIGPNNRVRHQNLDARAGLGEQRVGRRARFSARPSVAL